MRFLFKFTLTCRFVDGVHPWYLKYCSLHFAGFSLMRAAESPSCVHELLVERIPEKILRSGQVRMIITGN